MKTNVFKILVLWVMAGSVFFLSRRESYGEEPGSSAAGGDFIRAVATETLPAPAAAAAARIDTSRLKAHIAYLADPLREGRGLGGKGLAEAAGYIAEQLKAAGIAPLGDSYFQTVPMREVRPGKGRITLRTSSGTLTFQAGRNAVLPPAEPGALSGRLVFAGYGIREASLGHDDFRGLDVRGKIVVFLAGVPPGEAWQKPELLEQYASGRPADCYDARLEILEKLGAKAAVALEEGLDRRIAEGKEPAIPYFLAAPGVRVPGEPPLARAALTPELRALLRNGLEGAVELTIRGNARPIKGVNVLGRLEGAAPALRGEAVLIGAHMDHLGMPLGVVHPGADDNASGTAALLEISSAIAAGAARPGRTLIFAFWTGEEAGKFGSGHYTRNPLWPLAATRAYLNLDMIGHPWTSAEIRSLAEGADLKAAAGFLDGLDPSYFAEPGLAEGSRDLGPILARAGRATGMSLHLDWTDGRNGGSDYRDFARRDVPFVRFFGSYFPKYHTPEDTLDGLDPGQVRRMARLILGAAWLLADN